MEIKLSESQQLKCCMRIEVVVYVCVTFWQSGTGIMGLSASLPLLPHMKPMQSHMVGQEGQTLAKSQILLGVLRKPTLP